MAHAFDSCINLTYKATDIPNLKKVKNMSSMFADCEKFDGNPAVARKMLSLGSAE
jgi:hypothetical protein